MPPTRDRGPVVLRALLESTATPFAATRHARGASLFVQGDPCDTVVQIEAGLVRLTVAASNGKEAICGVLGPGAFVGEEALGGVPFRRATATAMTAADVLVVAKAEMVRLLRAHGAVADCFLTHMLRRETRLEADLADQLLHSSEERLARALIVLAGCGDGRGRRWTLPDVSQECIAEMVGTTRSRVNVFMRKFRKLGFIEEDDGVLRVTSSLLHVLHDDPDVSNSEHRHSAVGR